MHFSFLDFLSLATVLSATLIGVRGFTWDVTKKGIHKLTFTGWSAIFIALVAAYLSINQIREKNRHLENTEKLKTIAYADINEALDNIRQPFYILLAQVNDSIRVNPMHFVTAVINRPEMLDSLTRVILEKDDRILDTINFFAYPKLNPGGPYKHLKIWECLYHGFSEGNAQLNNSLARFSAYIPDELLVKIVTLMHNQLYVYCNELLPEITKGAGRNPGTEIGEELYAEFYDDAGRYGTFLSKLAEIQREVNKNATSSDL
jgi:hypothetical protein